MKFTDLFPSKYLSASALEADRNATIARVLRENVAGGGDSEEIKPIAYFEQKDLPPLVLNRTNGNTLLEAFGPNTEKWAGQTITLHKTTTFFSGKQVPAIRFRIPADPDVGSDAAEVEM